MSRSHQGGEQLGLDQVAIRRITHRKQAPYAPPADGVASAITSAFVKQALDRGAELFKWDAQGARRQAPGIEVRVSASR